MHGDTRCGPSRPQEVSGHKGFTCAADNPACPLTSARQVHSPLRSGLVSPQLTYCYRKKSAHEQRARTVSKERLSHGQNGRTNRDEVMQQDFELIPSPSVPSADVTVHTKNDPRQRSVIDKRVVVRIRGLPVNSGKKLALCAHPEDHAKVLCNRGTCLQEFQFSRVFADPDTNEDVYRDIGGKGIVVAVGQGIKETILAYGQTGSGKTHSLFGSGEEKGLTQFFIQSLFEWRSTAGLEQTISLCVIEVLGDMLYDLLPDCDPVANGCLPEIRWEECFIKTEKYKYKVVTVNDEQEALRILEEARQQRKVGGSHLNTRSSRSHAIVQFFVHTRLPDTRRIATMQRHTLSEPKSGDYAFYGVLTLADLAGCEREVPSYLRRTPSVAAGCPPKEKQKRGGCSRALNTSISALNRLMRKMQTGALDESDRRQSALNRLLFDYLQPECGVCMLFCLNPEASELQVSLSTLAIASDCRLIPCSRKQHLLRLEPLREFYTCNVFSEPANAIDCLVQARQSAGVPICMRQGIDGVEARGGKRALDINGMHLGTDGLHEPAHLEQRRPERERDGNTQEATSRRCTSIEPASGTAGSPNQGATVFQVYSKPPASLLAQTRETQTVESCFGSQANIKFAGATKRHSASSNKGRTEAVGPTSCVQDPSQVCLCLAQTDAITTPLATVEARASATRTNSTQPVVTWRGRSPACGSGDCLSVHHEKKARACSRKQNRRKHAAYRSLLSQEDTAMLREEENCNCGSPRPTQPLFPLDTREDSPMAQAKHRDLSSCRPKTSGDHMRASRCGNGASTGNNFNGSVPGPSKANLPTQRLSTRRWLVSSAPICGICNSTCDGEEIQDCDCPQKERSQCAHCSDGDSRTKRRHRRCCKHNHSRQWRTLSAHSCRQGEVEIHAEIHSLQQKLASLMRLCRTENGSSKTARRTSDLQMAYGEAPPSCSACHDTDTRCLLVKRRRAAHCEATRCSTVEAGFVIEENDQNLNTNESPYQQHTARRGQTLARAVLGDLQEVRGAPVSGVCQSGGCSAHTTRTADLFEETTEYNKPAISGNTPKPCEAVLSGPPRRQTESIDGVSVGRRSYFDSTLCQTPRTTEELSATSTTRGLRAEMSEEAIPSTQERWRKYRAGCTENKSRKSPAAQAQSLRDITQGFITDLLPPSSPLSVPEKDLSGDQKNSRLPTAFIRYSEQYGPCDGMASSASIVDASAEQELCQYTDKKGEPRSTCGLINPCLAPYTGEAFTPPDVQLETRDKPERLQRYSRCGDSSGTSSGMCQSKPMERRTVTPTYLDERGQAANVSKDSTVASLRSEWSPAIQSVSLEHRGKSSHTGKQTGILEGGERGRLQQRLRELLHLRQQCRWPQTKEALPTNPCAATKVPAPRKYISTLAGDCIQEELEYIIQRIHRLPFCQDLDCLNDHVPTFAPLQSWV